MSERQKVVAIGRRGGLLDQLEDLFAESAVDVQRFDNPEHALAVLDAFEVDLILVEYPLREHGIREFVVSASGRLKREGQKILVLSNREALEEILATVGDRFPVVGGDEPQVLRERVAPFLRKFPDRAKRLMVTMKVCIEGSDRKRMAQTENLSETGVLIRTGDKVPLGSEIEVELELPGDEEPLRAAGEVKRYHENRDGDVSGLGISFTRLSVDAANRLNAYLERMFAAAS